MQWNDENIFAKCDEHMKNPSFANYVWNQIITDEHAKSILFDLIRDPHTHAWRWIGNNMQQLSPAQLKQYALDNKYVLNWQAVCKTVEDGNKQHKIPVSSVCDQIDKNLRS